jgi:hypothetical protein
MVIEAISAIYFYSLIGKTSRKFTLKKLEKISVVPFYPVSSPPPLVIGLCCVGDVVICGVNIVNSSCLIF